MALSAAPMSSNNGDARIPGLFPAGRPGCWHQLELPDVQYRIVEYRAVASSVQLATDNNINKQKRPSVLDVDMELGGERLGVGRVRACAAADKPSFLYTRSYIYPF